MHSTRILSITLCLGLACLLLTGSALAGSTSANTKSYAKELAKVDQVWTLPSSGGNNFITRAMSVVRDTTQNFVLRLTLLDGAKFATPGLPTGADLELATNLTGGGAIQVTKVAGGLDGSTSVDFLVDIQTSFGSFPTLHIDTGGGFGATWQIKDTLNTLGNGTIQVMVQTFNAADNIEFDTGSATADWLKGINGVALGKDASLVATTATIDVRKGRLEFVPTTGTPPPENDDAANDKGATLGIDTSVGGVLGKDGTTYLMTATNKVNIVIEGDLSGIKEIIWDDGGGNTFTLKSTDSAFNITNGVATIKLDGNNGGFDGAANKFTITVDGTTVLNARTLQITVKLDFTDDSGGLDANDRDLVPKTNLTVWKLNGTILIANFMNGNNNLFNGRIYLFNPSSVAGNIAVRVFTLPLSGASTQLGGATLDLGSLPGVSGRNIRLAEDILTPLSIALPYLADGGNMVVEVVVEAAGVTGVGQVFQLDLSSFGIYPLSSVQ